MITIQKCESIGEEVQVYRHKSGLKVYVCEKKDYNSSYALFGTRYGSIDTTFKTNNGNEFITVPEGIAHFLEHKLFESEDGDAFSKYAKTGASANAYTSFDRTCYLFSASSNFEDSFKILLDFVQKPYFTEATVQKEQGIIGQEINMYDDSAPWRVFFNLLCAIYHNHPVRIDIAGTVESIAKINAQLLYDCYKTFYNLNNMFICVAGNVNAKKVFEMVDMLLVDQEPVKITRKMPDEPKEILKDYVEINLPVAQPLFAIGYKEELKTSNLTVIQRVATNIINRIIFSNESELFKSLLDQELINGDFSAELFNGYGYSSIIVDGESKDPKKVKEIVDNYILQEKNKGISNEDFQRTKKAIYGGSISVFNSVESTASTLVNAAFANEGVFEEIETLKAITLEDVNVRLSEILNVENSALSVVKSK